MVITESDRRTLSINVLFMTCVSPFRVAARFTVARWFTLVLRDAGTSGNAGSTRVAAAAWLAARGVTTKAGALLTTSSKEVMVITNTVQNAYIS